jgi:peptide/nickel transport system permease protein
MNSLRSLAQRLVNAIVLLACVLVLNFTLMHLAPGDPVQVLAGEMGGATQELQDKLRAEYGLDQPYHVQLLRYLARIATGDLGFSFYWNKPVTALIFERIGATLLLVVSALMVALLVGTLLGVIAAQYRQGLLSHCVTVLSLIGFAAPTFWVGILLVLAFAVAIPLFPVAGMTSAASDIGPVTLTLDVAWHLVLPALTLASVYLAFYSRLARASMIDVLGADYIRAARAKGLSHWLVIYKHALRNAILPVVTYAGLQFAQVISGAVLVETVFGWPGLGTLAFESILRRDTPTLLGILFFSGVVVVIVNIVVDILYRLIDPRINAR